MISVANCPFLWVHLAADNVSFEITNGEVVGFARS